MSTGAIVVGVVIGVVAVSVIVIAVVLYKKKTSQYGKYGKADDQNDDDNMVETADIVTSTKPFRNTEAGASTTKFSHVESYEEDEGLMDEDDDNRYEIQQWFTKHMDLNKDDIIKYSDLLIQNGYDVISSWRWMNKQELEMIGIHNRSHQRDILEAIKQYNINT